MGACPHYRHFGVRCALFRSSRAVANIPNSLVRRRSSSIQRRCLLQKSWTDQTFVAASVSSLSASKRSILASSLRTLNLLKSNVVENKLRRSPIRLEPVTGLSPRQPSRRSRVQRRLLSRTKASRVATLYSVEFVCYGLTYTTISKVIALWSNALVSAFLVTDPFETSFDRRSHDQIRPFARDLPHSLAVGARALRGGPMSGREAQCAPYRWQRAHMRETQL